MVMIIPFVYFPVYVIYHGVLGLKLSLGSFLTSVVGLIFWVTRTTSFGEERSLLVQDSVSLIVVLTK